MVNNSIKIFYFLVFLLFTFVSFSQSFQWLQNGGGNNTLSGNHYASKEQVIDIATDSQRNVYVISIISKDGAMLNANSITTYEANSNDSDFVLVSYSCDGSYRWHKVFGGGGDDSPSGIAIDSQDSVYITGFLAECDASNTTYYSIARIGDDNSIDFTSTNTPTSCQRTFLAKFDNNGNFQWIHFPYAPKINSEPNPFTHRDFYMVNDTIHWIISLPPGSYEGGAFSNTNNSLPFLYYLLKYDTSGNFISATPFDLELSNYTSAELRWYRNPYNGYYYAIYLNNSSNTITVSAGGNNLDYTLPKIICFNNLGQYQWHREPSGSQINFASLDFDSSNHLYLSGVGNSFISDTFLNWSVPSNTGVTSYIMKCNSEVTSYEWVTNFSVPGYPVGYSQQNRVLFFDQFNNELIFAGDIAGNSLYWSPITLTGPGVNNSSDPLLARFDSSNGNCLSMHRIVGTNGFQDSFTAIEQDVAGDLIVGGFMGLDLTDSNGNTHYTSGGNTDFFVTKFATQACQSLSNENFDHLKIDVFPNPTRDILNLNNVPETMQYIIYNLMGAKMLEGNISSELNSIDVSKLSVGCYLLSLKNEKGLIETFKIVKE